MGKHVIFLGAGASKKSGYPMANDLRLLISSRKNWAKALADYEDKHGYVGSSRTVSSLGLSYWDKHQEALDLFRNGGFSTIDEFCKLAGTFQFQHEINGLRCMVRAALGMFNPEENFEKSEYYGFVQSLFKDDLISLREDVSVLTYNYDPYLEFLLFRALKERQQVILRGKNAEEEKAIPIAGQMTQQMSAATSGLFPQLKNSWLGDANSKPSFCVLKLHGSICYYADETTSFENLFNDSPLKRAESLFGQKGHNILPPILFPWEMMGENGWVEAEYFKMVQHGGRNDLFRKIWERARREVQAADKISFVGLSMHSYLFNGLKLLFDGKENKTEIVIANPDNTDFIRGNSDTYWSNLPHSPAFSFARNFLNKIAPKMPMVGRLKSNQPPADGDITLVKNFEEFIKTQMKPLQMTTS